MTLGTVSISSDTTSQPQEEGSLGNYTLLLISAHVHVYLRAGTGDLMDVTDYLKCLNKSEIYDLGLVLGLDYHRVVDFEEKYSSNRRFLDSVVVSWLQKKDNVKDVSWKALVEALRHRRLGHNGIATSIATDHGMDLPLPHKHLIPDGWAIAAHLVHLTLTLGHFCVSFSGRGWGLRHPLFL